MRSSTHVWCTAATGDGGPHEHSIHGPIRLAVRLSAGQQRLRPPVPPRLHLRGRPQIFGAAARDLFPADRRCRIFITSLLFLSPPHALGPWPGAHGRSPSPPRVGALLSLFDKNSAAVPCRAVRTWIEHSWRRNINKWWNERRPVAPASPRAIHGRKRGRED